VAFGADNIDDGEIAHFEDHAADWWQAKGPLKALHDINPLRLGYIQTRCGIPGKTFLDVGCGGGILAEALAAAGGVVTGIDVAPSALASARAHMRQRGLDIEYRRMTVEAMARGGKRRFDAVTCVELLEHVPRPASIVRACAAVVKPGGDVFFATVNRTWTAYVLVLLAAERLLKIVRKGTHTYRRLVRPAELSAWAVAAGLTVCDISGFIYLPFAGRAWLSRFDKMNYLVHLKK